MAGRDRSDRRRGVLTRLPGTGTAGGADYGGDRVEPVLGPLISAARALGLVVEAPRVLGAGANLVVHLAPSPVVARVATLTAEVRQGAVPYLRRERLVSKALADQGVNVIPPTDLVDPGPHVIDGHTFLLLEYRSLESVDLDSPDHAEAVGQSLVELTRALAHLPHELGVGDEGHPWPEVATLVETVRPTTDAAAMERICDVVDALRDTEPDDGWQLVHGDAHRVNVALSGGQPIWFDFEDANRRPLAWDLATLRRSWPAAGDVACRILDLEPGSSSMRWHHEFREVYALLWNLLYLQRNRRAEGPTAERLALWLAEH